MSNATRNFPKNHDVILRYTKSQDFLFHSIKGEDSEYKTRFRRYLTANNVLYGSVKDSKDKLIIWRINKVKKELDRALKSTDVLFDFDKEFKKQSDVIYVSTIKGNATERTNYPTQKPLALLKRLIEASSNPNDIVLDPFCGCATACLAAHELNRDWIGIDISKKAIELVYQRFEDELKLFNPNIIHRTDIPIRSDGIVRSKEIKHIRYGEQEGYCKGCKLHFEFWNLTQDHIIPVSLGGSDDDSNLQLLCGNCNSIKGNRSMGYLRVKLEERKSGFKSK